MVNGLQLSTSPQIADAACVSGPASLGRRVVIAIIKIEYVVERGIYEPFDRVGDGAVRTSHSSQLHSPAPNDEDVLQVFRNAHPVGPALSSSPLRKDKEKQKGW